MDLDDFDVETRRRLLNQPSFFIEKVLDTEPYRYQKAFLDADSKRKAIAGGRQIGKTTISIWEAIVQFVKPNNHILIFSPSQRQAINFFHHKLKDEISEWIENEEQYGITYNTKTELHGANGSQIKSLTAANQSGRGDTVRGFTADLIIVDEAAFIDDEFYTSVLKPMLLTTGGRLILTGTPWGKSGYFYDRFNRDRWYTIQVSTQENPDVPADEIEEMREDLTHTEFRREVLGEFVQKENAAFPEWAIKQCVYQGESLGDTRPKFNGGYCYLGVDPARHGDDRAAFVSLDDDGNVFDVELEQEMSLPAIERRVRTLHNNRAYREILIDETGLGGGPVDSLKQEFRVVDGVTFTLQRKQEIYQTLRKVMEDESIVLPDEKDKLTELRGMERESTPRGNMKYHAESGGYDDFPDALALAVWAWKGGGFAERATDFYTFGGGGDDDDRSGKRAYSFGS